MSERAGQLQVFLASLPRELGNTGSATSQTSQKTQSTEVAALTPAALSKDMMSLQLRTDGEDLQLTEKIAVLLSMMEGLKEIAEMDHISDRPDEKDKRSENLQTGLLYKIDTEKLDGLEQESEHGQDSPGKPDEQEVTQVCEGPQASPLSPSMEENTPIPESLILKLNYWRAKMGLQMKELEAYHSDWLERINNVIQKINNTESTVKNLLTEVISLENKSKNLEDPDQDTDIEEKITEIRSQLKEVNIKLTQIDTCKEACELKEKLIEQIESFYKEMNVLNSKLEMYYTQGSDVDSHGSEDVDTEQEEPLPLEASPSQSASCFPPCSAVWKHALKLFVMFYIVTITGLSCYILIVDSTFLFKRVLPSMLGHRTMWDLWEMMAPFLNLETEDLLPS
ncbi:single-pass membrane and coiled-coil domain-containing protein 2 isoform X2 [Mastomys coucha]|uniref:single-pass membrane and coiled-coil domain-containing protein 2 isoform X2 n=1 Tax=Mastomys coucha TaxID=35658 RepID=UPI001261C975|nr:single-pass membrane and coiled-coil domain-containing protein 2 isoform X2 [Mastomys coucha]